MCKILQQNQGSILAHGKQNKTEMKKKMLQFKLSKLDLDKVFFSSLFIEIIVSFMVNHLF